MSDFSSGVKRYITGYTTVSVHFPVDFRDNPDVSCFQCKFFSRNNGICQLTKEISEYPQHHIASTCPLIIEEIGKND